MFATFTNDSRASSIFTTKALAEQVAAKQNAKAESMGISARYTVKEAKAGAAGTPRDTMPGVWA